MATVDEVTTDAPEFGFDPQVGRGRILVEHLEIIYEELDRAQEAFIEENPEQALIACTGGGNSQVLTINTVLFLIDEVANLRELVADQQETIDSLVVGADYAEEAIDVIGDTLDDHIKHGDHIPDF